MSATTPELRDTFQRLYRTMSLIRHFETAASRLLAAGELDGFLHLSIGQEAVAAGVCDVLDAGDYVTTTHRGHGHCIAKGASVERMLAELFARSTGYCGGRSGSMHVADPALGILGANAIVGACIPIALGGALAAQVLGERRVAVAFFGEGAVAEGVFHESLNIAALWHLPIVFVCENNGYAEMTPASKHLKSARVAEYANPHQVPAETVDGNDVLAVRAAAHRFVETARSGGGPALLECRTYRWHGHFEGDAQLYRGSEEVDQWRGRDPLQLLVQRIDDPELRTDLEDLNRRCDEEIVKATESARAQPAAEPVSLTSHVYRATPEAWR